MSTINSFLVALSASGFLHNAFIAPLLLVLGDFLTGLSSSLKNKNFDFSKLADVMGKDSDLLKYGVGAITLFVSNGLHILTPELNSFFGGVGSIAISVVILHSILMNLIELLPVAWQPEARVVEAQIETEVQSVLNQGSVTPPAAMNAVPYDQQLTSVGIPVVPAAQPQQYTMPSGLVSQQ